MKSATEENYLKETYALQLEHGQVTTSMLADRIGHAAPTVTGMLKKLASRKLVNYEPYQGVTLARSGKAAALEVIRHHRLLETYLTRALGVPWDRVHEEAEKYRPPTRRSTSLTGVTYPTFLSGPRRMSSK